MLNYGKLYEAAGGKHNALATICFEHGLRGYLELYEPFAQRLCAEGFNFVGVEMPGHGKSPGERGQIRHNKDLEACIRGAIVEAENMNREAVRVRREQGLSHREIPIIVVGFSVGGVAGLLYLFGSARSHIKRHLAGVVALGVPLDVIGNLPKFVGKVEKYFPAIRPIGRVVLGFLVPFIAYISPNWKVPWLKMDLENASHDPAKRERILADENIYDGNLTARTGYMIHKMALRVFNLLRNGGYKALGIPILFLRGERDGIAEKWPYRKGRIPVTDVPNFQHEVLDGEGSEEEVIVPLIRWIHHCVRIHNERVEQAMIWRKN